MRVAVITGGMGGLGDSISAKMHAAGYRVVVTHSVDVAVPARSASHGLPKRSDPLIFWSTTRV